MRRPLPQRRAAETFDAAVVLSLALQHGTPVDAIRHAITRNGRGEPSSILGAILDRLQAPAAPGEGGAS
jgi:hypothetical protein